MRTVWFGRTWLALLAGLLAGDPMVATAGPPEIHPARVGQPLQLRFTAIDGREVDLARLRGKVVLVDFWATWCAPCMKAMPALKGSYEKWREQGLEIVGINLDKRRETLNYVLKRERLEWPQAFDGLGLDGEGGLGARSGIQELPAMWLIDRQGKVRHVDAHVDMTSKLERLLAEK